MFDGGKIHVATKGDQPGTSYSPYANEFSGFDITVTDELLSRVGDASASYLEVQSKNRTKALHDGDAKLVAGTFSITADRMNPAKKEEGNVDFVGPYASTPQGILVRSKDYAAGKYHKLSDFFGTGEQVCVWGGTTSAKELSRKAYDEVSLAWEKDAKSCVNALLNGDVEAVSTDQLILYGFMQHNKETKEKPALTVARDVRFGAPNDYGIAIPKENREDCRRLRDALKEYVKDGNAWDDHLADNLPGVPKPERDKAKPHTSEIDGLSCRDKPANETAP